MFLQATRGQRSGAGNVDLVYYNVGRDNIDIVLHNAARFAAEAAGPREEEDEYHLYEEIGQRDRSPADTENHQYEEPDPQEETPYQRIDPQDVTVYNRVGAEGTEYHHYEEIPDRPRVQSEHHLYDDVDPPGGSGDGPGVAAGVHVYEVDYPGGITPV